MGDLGGVWAITTQYKLMPDDYQSDECELSGSQTIILQHTLDLM
jgi:hypothetical protein